MLDPECVQWGSAYGCVHASEVVLRQTGTTLAPWTLLCAEQERCQVPRLLPQTWKHNIVKLCALPLIGTKGPV